MSFKTDHIWFEYMQHMMIMGLPHYWDLAVLPELWEAAKVSRGGYIVLLPCTN